MLNALRSILLLCLVVWVGMMVFFSFFVAPSAFKVLPPEMAGALVSDIFPKYWAIGCISGVLSLASIIGISFIEKGLPAARIILLAVMTALTFYSAFVLAPEAKSLKAQAAAVEEPARKEALQKDFRRAHAKSFAVNIVVIAAGIGAVVLMSRNMRL